MSEQNVQVTQADREAAWPIWKWLFGDAADEAHFMDGDEDDHFVVQAFARHRTRTEPDLVEAAKKASNISINKGREIVIWFEDSCPEAFGVFNFFRAALTRADV